MKTWREYERLVALLTSEDYDDSYTVIPNARIQGLISKRKRQIDVLVEYRYDSDLNKRIVFDAKNRKRPIDIKDVEAFEGVMIDVNAKKGFLVCSNGYTKAAMRRAQEHIGIKLVPADRIDEINLNCKDFCLNDKCSHGLIFWDVTPGIIINGMVSVQMTGKCDECGLFHVWCWDCRNKKVLTNEDEWQCACKGPWFWLTAIEEDIQEKNIMKGVYLLLVLGNGTSEIVDRRPL